MITKKEIILPNVYVLTYDTQYDLCMSFVRMQEFHESPSRKIRGKYFTLEDYIDYWSTEQGRGSFDYPRRWNGFNLPSNVIKKWYSFYDVWGDIRDREREILEAIDELGMQEAVDEEPPDKYYVIGVHSESSGDTMKEVIEHELAHAMYYLNPAYKRAANKLLKNMDKKVYDKAEKMLLKMGYGKNVIKDEMQAYFSTNEIEENSKMDDLEESADFIRNFNEFRCDLKKEIFFK